MKNGVFLSCWKLWLIFLIILFLFTDGNKRAGHKKQFKNLSVAPLFYSSMVTGKKQQKGNFGVGPQELIISSNLVRCSTALTKYSIPPLAVQLKQKYLAHKLTRAVCVFLCKKATFQQVKRSHFIVPLHQLHNTTGGPKEKRTHPCQRVQVGKALAGEYVIYKLQSCVQGLRYSERQNHSHSHLSLVALVNSSVRGA